MARLACDDGTFDAALSTKPPDAGVSDSWYDGRCRMSRACPCTKPIRKRRKKS